MKRDAAGPAVVIEAHFLGSDYTLPDMDTPGLSMPSGQVCATCLHWRQEKAGEKTLGWGQCRRMPPTMPPLQDDKLVLVGLWPHTRDGDWCGEWQASVPLEHS